MATAKKGRPLSVKVRLFLAKNPNASAKTVASATGATETYVYNIKSEMKKRPAKVLPVTGVGNEYESNGKKWQAVEEKTQAQHDNVNHPAHYKVGGIETIDFIEAKNLNYHLGNVVKYVTRADHKGDKYEDLCKARWYLNREIAKLTVEK